MDGKLLGGFRKLDLPPNPIHKAHEKAYSESEIIIDPYPPQQGKTTRVSTVVRNTSDVEGTVNLEFGWAQFGMGIPFTTTGMTPFSRTVTLSPEMTATASVEWTPMLSGPQCIIVHLTDPGGIYAAQHSQRNVDVVDRPACGVTKVYTFTVANDSAQTVSVDIGLITFNVPSDWVVTTVPGGSVEILPGGKKVIEVHLTIPCPATVQDIRRLQKLSALQEGAGGTPIIDVEGYVDGDLVGGIELQFEPDQVFYDLFLPMISRK